MARVAPCSVPDAGDQVVLVRAARATDMPAVQAIYAHEVSHGLASFEEVPPTIAELLSRRERILSLGLPYLTAELNGRVVFGDHHMHGPEGVRFYTRLKTITTRWPTGVRSDVVRGNLHRFGGDAGISTITFFADSSSYILS